MRSHGSMVQGHENADTARGTTTITVADPVRDANIFYRRGIA